MPRTARASAGGVCYHVMNRGNGRATVFFDRSDYAGFVELIGHAGRQQVLPGLRAERGAAERPGLSEHGPALQADHGVGADKPVGRIGTIACPIPNDLFQHNPEDMRK